MTWSRRLKRTTRPDRRQPVKAGPLLRGGVCRASLDGLSPARQRLSKQADCERKHSEADERRLATMRRR
jgi:hypothetical protein